MQKVYFSFEYFIQYMYTVKKHTIPKNNSGGQAMNKCKFAVFLFFSMAAVFWLFAAGANAEENMLQRGIDEYKAENYEEALDFFQKARVQYPNISAPAFFLGLSYKQAGNYKEAVKHYRDATKLAQPVPEAYTELIAVLNDLNETKEAKEWIAKAEDLGIKPPQIAFLKGLVLAKENNIKGAVEAFTRSKELDKGLTQVADLQIAMAYAKANKLEEASKAFKAVIGIDPKSDLANFAKEYEKSIDMVLKAYRPLNFTAGVSYQYDDNVPGSAHRGDAAAQIPTREDYAVLTSLGATYTARQHGPWSFMSQLNLNETSYAHWHSNNTLGMTFSIVPGYNFEKGAFTLPLIYSHTWMGRNTSGDGKNKALSPYQETMTVKPTLNILLLPGHIGMFSAGYTKKEIFNRNTTAGPTDTDENRNGHSINYSAGYLRPFSGGKGMLNIKYDYTHDNTRGLNWMSRSDKIGATTLLPLSQKVNLTVSGDVTYQKYRNQNSNIAPAFTFQRKDRIYAFSSGILWEIFKNTSLNLTYSHTTNFSNIEIYYNKKNTYTAGIEYRF